MTSRVYGRVSAVEDGSPAWEAGLRPGDQVVTINSQPVRDILDYNYLCMNEDIEVQVLRDGELLEFDIYLDDEDPGIEFADDLFDGVHTCKNSCIFCFLQQMPKGLRKSLYVRDDDYRLSLAHGNYITLTNLSDEELGRICSQRMSPIYVSVHTTEPELRECMLNNKTAGRIMEQLRKLAEARITMNTQIVLCPDVNDGEHLDRSVHDLASLHPWVMSIGVVPVGLTKYREKLHPLHTFDRDSARQVIDVCTKWQGEFKRTLGSRLVFPSDEFYLLAGVDFPTASAYEGFPQLENGIGLSRVFLEELKSVSRSIARKRLRSGNYVLVTGTLASPLVEKLAVVLNSVDGVCARVCAVKNEFLGDTVTVAGLLSGGDVANAIQDIPEEDEVLIPDIMLNGERFLDDLTMDDLRQRSRARITEVPSSPRGVLKCLSALPARKC